MAHFIEVSLLYSLIEEFMGWLPARCLRQAHRRARAPETTLRLQQALQRLHGNQGASVQAPSYPTLARRLWRDVVVQIRRCQTPLIPHPLAVAERRVAVRYQDPEEWPMENVRSLDRTSLWEAFPEAGFGPAVELLGAHGNQFARSAHLHVQRAGPEQCTFTNTVTVSAMILGFEVRLRMRWQTVVPLPRTT